MQPEESEPLYNYIYMDEAGFNLMKHRGRARNTIAHRATVDVPGQQRGNITMGADISENGENTYSHYWAKQYRASFHLCRHSLQGSHPWTREGLDWRRLTKVQYMIVWDNVSFHCSNIIRQWFATHNRMLMEFLQWRAQTFWRAGVKRKKKCTYSTFSPLKRAVVFWQAGGHFSMGFGSQEGTLVCVFQ